MVTECAQGSFLITAVVARTASGRGVVRHGLRWPLCRTTPLTLVFGVKPPSLVLRGIPTKNSLTCAAFAPYFLLYRHSPLTALLHALALATLASPRRSLRSRMPVARYARECSLGARWLRGLRGVRHRPFIYGTAPLRDARRPSLFHKGCHYGLAIMPLMAFGPNVCEGPPLPLSLALPSP